MYAQSMGQSERYDELFERTSKLNLREDLKIDYDCLVRHFALEPQIDISLSGVRFNESSLNILASKGLINKISSRFYEFP